MKKTWYILFFYILSLLDLFISGVRIVNASTGSLSFDMSISLAFDNGFDITSVIATLTNENYSITKDLTLWDLEASGSFDDLTEGEHTLNVELYYYNDLIACGSGEGVISIGKLNYFKARILVACSKLILIVNWHPDEIMNVESFYNYSIDSENHHLKLYHGLNDIKTIALEYKEASMKWFYRCQVNHSILDSTQVPMTHYSFGDHRNPVTICQTAFGFYDDYLETGAETDKQGFLNNVNWILNNHDENYYLHYDFEWYHTDEVYLPAGWISAMAQGEALAAVSMAYCLTGNENYRIAAEGFFKTLYSNIDSLWCIGIDHEDYYWLEEYPNKDFCHVLNGMFFALWGIWDYYVISSDEFALTLLKAGIKTIVDHYPIWNVDNQNYSYY